MQMAYSHIPYTLLWDRAPVDISFLFESEKPAGKHGFMTVKGDSFVFEDGTQMRFWGTNFNSGANYPEHGHSEKVAQRLASFGINIVRFHQLDSEWATPNIFQFAKGPRCSNTRSLDPRSMERLDYLIYCLKEQGIYVYLDMLCYRKFKSGDGVENAEFLVDAAKPYSNFSRKLIDLQKEFNHQLWCHFNPYTKLCYKDDPAIAFCEVTNENDMFTRMEKFALEPYRSELVGLYADWLRENNIPFDESTLSQTDFEDHGNADIVRFKCEIMKKYYREIIDDCRQMGVKTPIAGTTWPINGALLEAQMVTDFTDGNAYSWAGDQRSFQDCTLTNQRFSLLSGLAFNRVDDKPFFVSEWDEPWPSMYRADSPLLMAAVGSLQGWYGLAIHTYRYGTNEQESVTSKIGRDIVIGNSYYRGIFDTYNDPAKFGLFYHAALIMRRGDVRQAEKCVAIEHKSLVSPPWGTAALNLTTEHHKVVSKLPGRDHGSGADIKLAPDEQTEWGGKNEVISDTGELFRNLEKGYGHIDTPMTKAVYGFHARGSRYDLDGMEISVQNDFATVAVSSISENPICASDNLLLTAVGRADNKNAVYHENHTKQADCGTGPIMVEVIRAKIKMKTSVNNLRIWSVDNEGFYTGSIPISYENGYATFEIGNEFASIYYLIQAQ